MIGLSKQTPGDRAGATFPSPVEGRMDWRAQIPIVDIDPVQWVRINCVVAASRGGGPHHPWEYSRDFGLRRTVTTFGTRATNRGQRGVVAGAKIACPIDALRQPYPHGTNVMPSPRLSLGPPTNGRLHVASRNSTPVRMSLPWGRETTVARRSFQSKNSLAPGVES